MPYGGFYDSRFPILRFSFISIILLLTAISTSCSSRVETAKKSAINTNGLSEIFIRSGDMSAAITKLPAKAILTSNSTDALELDKETIPQLMEQFDSEALEKTSDTDTIGITHKRYKQYYKGLEVIGAELLEHTSPKGEVYFIHGKMLEVEGLSIKLGITAEEAISLVEETHESEFPYIDKDSVRLVIKNALLCHEIYYINTEIEPNKTCLLYVDAQNGSEVDNKYIATEMKDDPVAYFTEPITASGYLLEGERNSSSTVSFPALLGYDGITGSGGYCYDIIEGTESYIFQNLQTNSSNTYKRFIIKICDLFPENANYTNYNDYKSVGYIVSFTESELEDSNISSSAVSAAYNITRVMQYTHDVLGRNSFNNNNYDSELGIEVSCPAVLYIDSELNTQYIDTNFGGFYERTQPYPFCAFYFYRPTADRAATATLDVVAHEFCHAITNFSSNLTYVYNAESMALNESYSDIFSVIVENYYQPDGTSVYPDVIPGHFDWYLGEDSWISIIASRDLRNPEGSEIAT